MLPLFPCFGVMFPLSPPFGGNAETDFPALATALCDNATTVNLSDVMIAAHQEIYRCIDDFRNGMIFEGVKSLRFKLIIDKPSSFKTKPQLYHL